VIVNVNSSSRKLIQYRKGRVLDLTQEVLESKDGQDNKHEEFEG
jgi:hypothetical protein